MAGIGFVLRKLTQRGDLLGVVEGFGHSALAATGPWLFTILSLVGINLLGSESIERGDIASFRIITIYNFAFSLVFAGPVVMVATRYLADQVFERDVRTAPGMLLGALSVMYLAQAPFVIPFYLIYLKADLATKLGAIAHFFLVSSIWLVGIFLTALKEHRAITWAFGGGMTVGMVAAVALGRIYAVPGMLAGFSLGLLTIFFPLVARIYAEYRFEAIRPFEFMGYFRKHWVLASSGLVYNVAIWVDKWIMWQAPQGEMLANGLISYPDYDSAMFLSCLAMAPAMGLFVFSVETDFFEHYLRYYRDIQRHATFHQIERNHRRIMEVLLANTRNFLVLQVGVTVVMIALAPHIFASLYINFSQFGMYRLGVLGALFQVLFLFIGIVLSYFELDRVTLALQVFFLVTNAAFSLISLQMGFAWYGYGYFLAALTTFLVSFFALAHYVGQLPYVSFIRANPSVR